ncbi:class I SAM-dependent methyltransferase [Candidatus Zixiibacteriota bacterium]
MDFDRIYRTTKNYFGESSNPLLEQYRAHIDKSNRILDLGAGQGRNTLFLARLGHGIDAVDPSQVAIETISSAAAGEGLDVRTYHCDFEAFQPETDRYSAILTLGLIQLLSWQSIEKLIEKIRAWTCAGSLVFVMAFTTADPTFDRFKHSADWAPAGRNSFRHPEEGYRTYLELGELLQLFAGWSVMHHQEDLGREHRHGDGRVACHVWAEGVFQRVE